MITLLRTGIAMMGLMAVILCGARATGAEWQTDFAKASVTAKKTGQYMLLDFTGSDWCGWCIQLDKEVFEQSVFKDYAKQNLTCVTLDFPRKKKVSEKLAKQNNELAKKYAIQGYPTIIILSPNGELVGKTGYESGGPEKYVESLKKMISEYEKVHPKTRGGDATKK